MSGCQRVAARTGDDAHRHVGDVRERSTCPSHRATRPKFTVPSASRGVGGGGPRLPSHATALSRRRRRRALRGARPAAPAPCVTQTVDENTTTAIAPTSAVRRLNCLTVYPPVAVTDLCALARRREEALAGLRQDDRARVAGRAAVLREAALDGDLVADLHGVARPALPHQAVRAAHFHRPVRHLLGLLVGDVDVEEGVRVHPLNLRDGAGHLERLGGVELRRERVVRHHRARRR